MPFYAHSANDAGQWDPLGKHLSAVASLAADFASHFGERERAYLAGLLHDLGKYGDLFQRRLRNEESRIDHWSAGAWVSLIRYQQAGPALALAIQGHHTGLQQWTKAALKKSNPATPRPPEVLRLSESNPDVLLSRLAEDGLSLPATIENNLPEPAEVIARMPG